MKQLFFRGLRILICIFYAQNALAAEVVFANALSPESLIVLTESQSKASTSTPAVGMRNFRLLSTNQSSSLSSAVDRQTTLVKTRENEDHFGVRHTRYQQWYQGIPVYGARLVLHRHQQARAKTPKQRVSTMEKRTVGSGRYFKNIVMDLGTEMPSAVFTATNAEHAVDSFKNFLRDHERWPIETVPTATMDKLIFVDPKTRHAVYAYRVAFLIRQAHTIDAPTAIVNAKTGELLRVWNNLHQNTFDDYNSPVRYESMRFKGNGGNEGLMGLHVYGENGWPFLSGKRDVLMGRCVLTNSKVIVKNFRGSSDEMVKRQNVVISEFPCPHVIDPYKNENLGQENGAYSPENDALYFGTIVENMYEEWYHVPALQTPRDQPMILEMVVHYPMENAFWDGSRMVFGTGLDPNKTSSDLYPLVSLDIVGHEVSHGFTEQHSALWYYDQSGALDESFSDIAAKAISYYHQLKIAGGTLDSSVWNTAEFWRLGADVSRINKPIRYMNQPSLDARERRAFSKSKFMNEYITLHSLDSAADYATLRTMLFDHFDEETAQALLVHSASGVFNRAYYLLSTTAGWNPRKAFDAIEYANQESFWDMTTTFEEAACGVIQAANVLNSLAANQQTSDAEEAYSIADIRAVFQQVGLDTQFCTV